MKKYLKTLFIFPIILQLITTALLLRFEESPISHAAITAFFLATIPAFLIASFVTKYRYTRYNIASIVLSSSLIAFFYCNITSYLYLALVNEEAEFGQWFLLDGFIVGLLNTCGIVIYTLFVLPWFLPKDKS